MEQTADTTVIKRSNDRWRIYLLRASRFRIVTAHTQATTALFNKVMVKMPPRIKKWVMDIQDVDYDL